MTQNILFCTHEYLCIIANLICCFHTACHRDHMLTVMYNKYCYPACTMCEGVKQLVLSVCQFVSPGEKVNIDRVE